MAGILPSTGYFIDNKGRILHFTPPPKITNLVLEGGGPRGFVYTGALATPEMKSVLKDCERIGGSSAGALTSALIAAGYTPEGIAKIANDFDLESLKDLSDDQTPSSHTDKIKKGLSNLSAEEKGIYLGNKLLAEVRQLIRKQVSTNLAKLLATAGPDSSKDIIQALQQLGLLKPTPDNPIALTEQITFQHLHYLANHFPELGFKELFLTGTNVSTKSLDIFSNETQPDMEVALAVRISMSIPVMFQRVSYNGYLYEDGGCLKNFPMDMFEDPVYRRGQTGIKAEKNQNMATLGLKVDTQKELREILWKEKPAPKPTKNILAKVWDKIKSAASKSWNWITNKIVSKAGNYVAGVDMTQASKAGAKMVYDLYSQRTIQIDDKGYKLTQFKLSDHDKETLRKSGEDATKEWFQHHRGELVYEKFDALSDMSKEELQSFYSFLKNEATSNKKIFPTSNLSDTILTSKRRVWIKKIESIIYPKANAADFDPLSAKSLIERLKLTLHSLEHDRDTAQDAQTMERLKSDMSALDSIIQRSRDVNEEIFTSASELAERLQLKIESQSQAKDRDDQLAQPKARMHGLFSTTPDKKKSIDENPIKKNRNAMR